MSGNTTVDDKPHSLPLNKARPRGRSAPSPQPMFDGGYQVPFPSGYGYPNQFMMPTMPMMYNQVLGQNPSYPFPQYPALAPTTSAQPQGTGSRPKTIEYPEVTRWFHFLDEHEERSKDGIHFQPFGEVLKRKGFLRITQLTLDFIMLKDLQDWLGIDVGTAILIMQYAKEDVEDIKAGNLVIPKEMGMDFQRDY